ncbi:MAG: hypothetical protein ABW022_25800 [Actinoplanes sp.]
MTRLIVERIDKPSRRPWIFVTGRLEGDGELRIGDDITITQDDSPAVSTVIRSIELHSPSGRTTIAVDEDLAGAIAAGAVISQTGLKPPR